MLMLRSISLLALLLLSPLFTFAHDGSGSGFLAGLGHPVLGLDHLLAMISVGILSAQMGGKAIWTVPATFVTVMLVGGLVGIGAQELPCIETGIAISVVILGIAIGFKRNFPVLLVMGFVAFFAFFHGYAHGVEMPSIAQPLFYSGGFMLSTIAIHLAGVFLGSIGSTNLQRKILLRSMGVFMAGMGFQMLIG